MRIYGNFMDFQVAGVSSASAAENEINRHRAAELRRRLMKIASEAENQTNPEEAFLVDQWKESRHDSSASDETYSSTVASDLDFE
jgi:hypothetical protein